MCEKTVDIGNKLAAVRTLRGKYPKLSSYQFMREKLVEKEKEMFLWQPSLKL